MLVCLLLVVSACDYDWTPIVFNDSGGPTPTCNSGIGDLTACVEETPFANIMAGEQMAHVMTFSVTAGPEEGQELEMVELEIIGDPEVFTFAYLSDAYGNIAEIEPFQNGKAIIYLSNGPIVNAGTTALVYVLVDVNPATFPGIQSLNLNAVKGHGLCSNNATGQLCTNPAENLIQVMNMGTLTFNESDSPAAGTLLVGSSATTCSTCVPGMFSAANLVAKYEGWALFESFEVSELTIVREGASNDSDIDKVWIQYPDYNGVLQPASMPLINGEAHFQGLNPPMFVTQNKPSFAPLNIYLDVSPLASPGNQIRMTVKYDNGNSENGTFWAVGVDSAESLFNPEVNTLNPEAFFTIVNQ